MKADHKVKMIQNYSVIMLKKTHRVVYVGMYMLDYMCKWMLSSAGAALTRDKYQLEAPVTILGVNMFWKGNLIDLVLASVQKIMNFRYMWSAETQRE